MAYKSLYRAYRPQTFDEVAGQKFIVKTLQNAIEKDKIAHAYIFAGPRGTGKTSLAKIFAKGINCTSKTDKPCNNCPNCLSVTANSHPDIIEIDAASNNGVDEIREIIDKVKYAPMLGRKKVYIIDEVHMLSANAFNAFLKTLEEPPSHVVFILATTEPQKVLPTILSRCQRFDFNKVSNKDIMKRIKSILDAELIGYDEEVISLIAELAEGGVRDALSITDQTIAYAGEQIKADDVKEIYGIASAKEKIAFLTALVKCDVQTVFTQLADFDNKALDFVRFTNELILILKDVIIFSIVKNEQSLLILEKDQAASLQSLLSNDIALASVDILIEAISNYKKTGTVKTFLELALLRIIDLFTINAHNSNHDLFQEKKKEKIDSSLSNVAVESSKKAIAVPEKAITTHSPPSRNASQALPLDNNLNVSKDSEITFDEQAIINVLVQGDKEQKQLLSSRWEEIGSKYLTDPKTAQIAVLLIDSIIFAVGGGGLILAYSRRPQMILAKKLSNMKDIIAFLKMLTGKEYVIYPILVEEGEAYKNIFINLKNSASLPKAQPIKPLISTKQEKERAKPTSPELIFGDLLKEE